MGGLKGGDMSIYGKSFEDESYSIPHDQEGIVTMLNDGPDTNSS
jgi:cyclophilin family peptidyl-prolyl cis-trans isomerase